MPQLPRLKACPWGRRREPRRNPCNYFPRSFTISKKYPDLGENISRVPKGGGRGLDGSTEDQNKFPTTGKDEARQAAAPGRPSRIAPDSEDSGVPFKVSLRCFPSLGFRHQQIFSTSWVEKGACFHGRAHSFHGTIARGSGRPGLGSRGRGGSRRRDEPGRATRGEVRGWPFEGAPPAASLSATPAPRSCLK